MPDVILVRGPLSSRQSARPGAIDRVSRANEAGVLISKPRKRMAPCSLSFCSMKSVLSLYHEVNNPDSDRPLSESYSTTNGTLHSGSNRPVLIMACSFFFLSLRSRRENKAWGASPRVSQQKIWTRARENGRQRERFLRLSPAVAGLHFFGKR